MSDPLSIENDFLHKLREIVESNISNEQFGVSELAHETGMSRSNLLRKIQKHAKVSASQFIRQVRLQRAMELLKQNTLNVSEVCYEVGFSSTSYFIKCFREFYGYPPGEVGKHDNEEDEAFRPPSSAKHRKKVLFGAIVGFIVVAVVLYFFLKPGSGKQKELEKSIAVLPFINDSNDSTNVHIINGLMESVLNNLQKIKDLRVISRTSVEKYRHAHITIPEIARELNVSYIVEGSGQKINDQILLTVQLIEASKDKHLWSKQYSRETEDIFDLQKEVAKNIASKIEVIITPEEEERIDKIPTDNLLAYEYYLKGLDFFYKQNRESMEEAIVFFKKAIEEDDEFASAYANIAIAYYFLDIFKVEKIYTDQINNYADKALLFDLKLPESLIAKALYYMHIEAYERAVPYLEKALEYNPNSAMVINILSDFYTNYIPDTRKYLEYAIKGIRLNIAANDSVTASFIYLHVSNSLIQTGFIDKAIAYVNRSLAYNPDNLYSEYVKAYILYAKNSDLERTKDLLMKALKKDTSRLDILQEVGKLYYYLRDYENSYVYYKKFLDAREAYSLDIYQAENAKIGYVLNEMGFMQESKSLFNQYKAYAENDHSIYKHLSLAMYYSYHGKKEKAIEHLEKFSQQENYHYWLILFLKIDPLTDNIKELPEYKQILIDIETQFWDNHKQVRAMLEEEELL